MCSHVFSQRTLLETTSSTDKFCTREDCGGFKSFRAKCGVRKTGATRKQSRSRTQKKKKTSGSKLWKTPSIRDFQISTDAVNDLLEANHNAMTTPHSAFQHFMPSSVLLQTISARPRATTDARHDVNSKRGLPRDRPVYPSSVKRNTLSNTSHRTLSSEVPGILRSFCCEAASKVVQYTIAFCTGKTKKRRHRVMQDDGRKQQPWQSRIRACRAV